MVTGHAWPVGLHLHVGVFGTNRWRRLYLPLVELTRKLLVDAFDGTVQLHLTERYHSAYWLLADRCRVLRVELTRLTGCDVGMQWFKWKSFFWGVLLTIWVSSDAEFEHNPNTRSFTEISRGFTSSYVFRAPSASAGRFGLFMHNRTKIFINYNLWYVDFDNYLGEMFLRNDYLEALFWTRTEITVSVTTSCQLK